MTTTPTGSPPASSDMAGTASSASHASGPWFLATMNDGLFVIDQPPRPAPVDHVNPNALPGVQVIATVHAGEVAGRALAAAPELLAACKEVLAVWLANFDGAGSAVETMRRAIAKATAPPDETAARASATNAGGE